MGDLSGMIEIARSALFTYRAALDVTSENVANAQTPGYSRQQADIQPNISVKTSFGYLGTGVNIEKIQRMRESFLDQEVRNTNVSLGQANIQSTILDRVQSYLNEPASGGISSALDNFFAAFQNLAANPEDSGVRESVIQQGVSLSKEFNYLATGLQTEKSDILLEVDGRVKQINDLTSQIASLNRQIFSLSPSSVNEAEDLRDQKVDALSKLIDAHASKDQNGMVNISSGGSNLVSGVTDFPIDFVNSKSQISVVYKGTNTNLGTLSGEIGAHIDAYNSTIPGFQQKLDLLATTLMNEVNKLHSGAYGLPDKTANVASTGNDFFKGTDAMSMKVNSDLLNDSTKVAASADGAAGNNQIALDIANLLDKPVFNNQTTSMLQYYRSFVSDIGFKASDAKSSADSLSQRFSNLDNMRTSVSGVSLDDEMVNLIKYQRGFDAASKLVSTVDQLYETILGLIK